MTKRTVPAYVWHHLSRVAVWTAPAGYDHGNPYVAYIVGAYFHREPFAFYGC